MRNVYPAILETLSVLCFPLVLFGASGRPVAQSKAKSVAGQSQPEVIVQEEAPTFKARVNLVLVPVVVRDREGRPIGDLRKEDFQLFDRGKPQTITKFSVETPAGHAAPGAAAAVSAVTASEKSRPPLAMPRRYVAYLFDDVHLGSGDLTWVRDGADRNLRTLEPTDRAAIFTTSGRTALEFTDDRAKLHEMLLHLRPNPIAWFSVQGCPDVSYYMADLIWNRGDPGAPVQLSSGLSRVSPALEAAIQEAIVCLGLDPNRRDAIEIARRVTLTAARRALAAGDTETRAACMALKQVVRRVGAMPGQRTVVLLSPGFLTLPGARLDVSDAVDLATRLNVVINALDARGLYTGMTDLAKKDYAPRALAAKREVDHLSAVAEADVLAQVADGTGGRFVQNTNDIDSGLRRIATAPEYTYVLGFSPRDLKPDGSHHGLRVRLVRQQQLTVQARRGYFASKQVADPGEAAEREIEEAVFAPEDIHDPAVEVHTEFFKSGTASAELTVVAHLDLRHIMLQKAGGRNSNDLTIVSGLFDRNGNYATGNRKTVKLRLRDETLASWLGSGITVRSSFDVQAGTYAVRVVVRDAQGQLMTAKTSVVEIP